MNQGYYIYSAWLDGECVYVGKGNGSRYKHLTSGTSSCYEANKAHFNGSEVEVKFLREGLTEEAAFRIEGKLITKLNPPWNKRKAEVIRSSSLFTVEQVQEAYEKYLGMGLPIKSKSDFCRRIGLSDSGATYYFDRFGLDGERITTPMGARTKRPEEKAKEASNERLLKAIAILEAVKSGSTIKDACKDNGIAHSTFDNYKREHKDVLTKKGYLLTAKDWKNKAEELRIQGLSVKKIAEAVGKGTTIVSRHLNQPETKKRLEELK